MFRKKLLVSMMAASMVLGTVPQQVMAAETSPVVSIQEWKKGQTIGGFQVTDVSYNKTYQSNIIRFTHTKTGAQVMWFKNKEANRAFSIGFHTPATNDKGMNHILEHSVVGGGKKYRSANMLFTVMSNTYTPFINAMTAQNFTMYPIGSSSEAQLLKDADIYLDGVFHPYLLEEKKVFQREAWRYELNDINDPLKVAGTVYTEMKGAASDINTAARNYLKKALFQGTDQATISGGDSDAILDLTYEELCETYHKNYHPSNSFSVLYGDIKCEDFLKLLDSYFNEYTKKDVSYERKVSPETDSVRKFTYKFPMSEGVDTTNKSILMYAVTFDDMKNISLDDYTELNMIQDLLASDNGPLMKALKQSKIASSYEVYLDDSNYQPYLYFSAKDADESKASEFEKIVKEELNKIVENGYDKEFIRSTIKQSEYTSTITNDQAIGFNIAFSATALNDILGDPLFDLNARYLELSKRLDDNCLEKTTKKYIIDNKRQALVVVKPVAGLQEDRERKLEKSLQEKKKSMTKEELEQLVQDTKDFVAFNNQETTPEMLESLKGIEAKDIPYEPANYDVKHEVNEAGTNLYTTKIGTPHVNSCSFRFDESHLTNEELMYLKVYLGLLGRDLATTNRTSSEVMNQKKNYSNGYAFGTSVVKDELTKVVSPNAQISFYSMDDTYTDAVDLLQDVLLNTNLTKATTEIKEMIDEAKTEYGYTITDPFMMAAIHSLAYNGELYQYSDYLGGLEYYKFMFGLDEEMNHNPSSVVDKLIEVRDKAFNQEDLTVFFVGDNDSMSSFNKVKDSMTAAYPNEKTTPIKRELPKPSKREAWVIPTDVQHVIISGNLERAGVKYDGSGSIMGALLKDQYLIPGIRLNGGAYDTAVEYTEEVMDGISFRDINYLNSLNVLQGMGDYLIQIAPTLTQQQIDSYMLPALANYNVKLGDLIGGMQAATQKAMHYDPKKTQKEVEELKSTTPEDAKKLGEDYKKLIKTGNYVVVLPQSALEGHEDLFDNIVKLY